MASTHQKQPAPKVAVSSLVAIMSVLVFRFTGLFCAQEDMITAKINKTVNPAALIILIFIRKQPAT
jgi:hypothetical protein